MALAKPNLRNLNRNYCKKALGLSIGGGIVSAFLMKYFVINPRSVHRIKFWRTYDAEADFDRMVMTGNVFKQPINGEYRPEVMDIDEVDDEEKGMAYLYNNDLKAYYKKMDAIYGTDREAARKNVEVYENYRQALDDSKIRR